MSLLKNNGSMVKKMVSVLSFQKMRGIMAKVQAYAYVLNSWILQEMWEPNEELKIYNGEYYLHND